MKKIKVLIFLFFVVGILLIKSSKLTDAFSFAMVCQPPLTYFSNGNSTFDIAFESGGETTCSTFPPADNNCPTVSLPVGSTVYSFEVKISTAPDFTEIGTPYIWVPVSEGADKDQIKQISTADCSIVQSYPTGDNPSRTFVIPGGDTWVANRDSGDVTKLSPLAGNAPAGGTCGNGLCGTDETTYYCPADCNGNICGPAGIQDCREYEVIGNYATGAGPRGITGDTNGNIWVGNAVSANVSKLNPATGAKLIPDIGVGGYPYGMIGDSYGHVWISNRGGNGSLQCIKTNPASTETIADVTTPYNFPAPGPYGIGMDKDGSIYLACYECGTVLKFDAVTGVNCPGAMAPSVVYNTGVALGTRGVAVDQNGYVWTSNSGSNKFYVFTDPATRFEVSPGGTNVLGAAIDFDGFGWTASYNSGDVYKYSFDGASLNLECSVNVNGNPYNYSDMTGLRTIPKTISVALSSAVPESSFGGFEICSDGTNTCTDPVPCSAITAYLAACVPDGMNNCEIPLEVFSMQAGKYRLEDLKVIYGKQVPVTTGGLIPCGREWDNPDTSWNDTVPCEFCFLVLLINKLMNFLVELAFIVALLALIITGFLFITSQGNQEKLGNAKKNLKWVILGILIIFLAWIVVDFLLTAWGFLDPMGGKWDVIC